MKRTWVRGMILALVAPILNSSNASAEPWNSSVPDFSQFGGPFGIEIVRSTPEIAEVGIAFKPLIGPPPVYGFTGFDRTLLIPFINFLTGDPRRNQIYSFPPNGSQFMYYEEVIDNRSHIWHEFRFSGYFTGTMTAGASHISAVFTSPDTQSVRLFNYLYTVHLSYTPVGPPTILPTSGWPPDTAGPPGTAGSINAAVTGAPVQLAASPEPGGFVLALLGLPVFGFVYWSNRRA
jgi:hypothetical protein